MKFKLINFILFILVSSNTISQELSVIVNGKIYNTENKLISDVHIVNINNRRGTISRNNGTFELSVKENDTLLFSSIEYHNIRITVLKHHIDSKKIEIELNPIVNELDEVFLHGLTGSLEFDYKKTPEDTIQKDNFRFKLSDLDKKLSGDEFGYKSRVNAESFTNPVYLAGGGQGSKFNKQLEKERALKKKLNRKKNFPIKLQKELGTEYFVKTLKIPEDEIFRFIDFCEPYKVRNKYYNNKVLSVIEILKNESIKYNEN